RSIALFRGPQDSSRSTEIQERIMLRRHHIRLVAQGGIHRRRIDNLPRVENMVGIPAFLYPSEKLVIRGSYHHGDKGGPHTAIAMLSTEGAVVGFDPLGDGFTDMVNLLHVFGLLKPH